METSKFIDDLIAGNSAEAKDSLNDLLSQKAFAALEDRKIEIAQSIYTNQDSEDEEGEEVDSTEEEQTA
jgi:hypothetical protein|tara:strand:+ start:824 stop:1030 length:207 start_codon:yes stop_codon:yes gene_type:complete